MSDLHAGLGALSYSLGRLIDPQGHAKDEARRRKMAALCRRCPTCGVPIGSKCRTRHGKITYTPHKERFDKV